MSESPKISEHFIGTGETFVFKLKPELETFRWSGHNEFYFKVDLKNGKLVMRIGLEDGKSAIWLDEELNRGRSESCKTFDSPQLNKGNEDFTLKTLECWAFE